MDGEFGRCPEISKRFLAAGLHIFSMMFLSATALDVAYITVACVQVFHFVLCQKVEVFLIPFLGPLAKLSHTEQIFDLSRHCDTR